MKCIQSSRLTGICVIFILKLAFWSFFWVRLDDCLTSIWSEVVLRPLDKKTASIICQLISVQFWGCFQVCSTSFNFNAITQYWAYRKHELFTQHIYIVHYYMVIPGTTINAGDTAMNKKVNYFALMNLAF